MSALINPRTLKGFRDSLPGSELKKRTLIRKLEQVFKLFGFVPIDTPALEYSEVLLGKGGGETDKQVYRFFDNGTRDVALRYDLTVPFARFVAAHISELYMPFKRYHIAKVWRGENTQRGRFREFTQCDFDIVGTDTLSSDFEILLIMARSMEALGIGEFRIHFSHRGIFNRLLRRLGLDEQTADILRTVDKLPKLGPEKTSEILRSFTGDREIESILKFITPGQTFDETLALVIQEAGGESEDSHRLAGLKKLIDAMELDQIYVLDPSITRGLDYYTGIVFETFLADQPELGSICSGGRYNDLASLYTKKSIPGVGSSIGLDRICAALEKPGMAVNGRHEPILLIICMDENFLGHYHKTAKFFRQAGVSVEVFAEKKKLARQFQFAEKKGIPLALICGEAERAKNTFIIKDLRSRDSYENLTADQSLSKVRELVPISHPCE